VPTDTLTSNRPITPAPGSQDAVPESAGLVVPLRPQLVVPSLAAVGSVVDDLYPSGAKKLADRCADALEGRARGSLVLRSGQIVAFSMESPKGRSRIKLSTLWVRPDHRREGLCRALVAGLVEDWLIADIEQVHITVRIGIHYALDRALSPYGFCLETIVSNRYGNGRDEAVLCWRPDRVPDPLWLSFRRAQLVWNFGIAS
jgi:hypothetical protein